MHRIYKVLLNNEFNYEIRRNKAYIEYMNKRGVQFQYNGPAEDFVKQFRKYAKRYDPLDVDSIQEAKDKLISLLEDFEKEMESYSGEFQFKEVDEDRGIEEFYCAIINILDGLAIHNMDMTSKWENILDVLDEKGKVHWFDEANYANDAGNCKNWTETLTKFKELWINENRVNFER